MNVHFQKLGFFSEKLLPTAAAANTKLSSALEAPNRKVKLNFIILHGFLSHSGTFFSFNRLLRQSLETKENNNNNTSNQQVQPNVQVFALDARNHGLSPRGTPHNLEELKKDLKLFLESQKLYDEDSVGQMRRGKNNTNTNKNEDTYTNINIAVGHSMGSGTWTKFLMDEHQSVYNKFTSSASLGSSAGKLNISAFVSMDMPPIAGTELAPELRKELLMMLHTMKKVNLAAITDNRSAAAEFQRILPEGLPPHYGITADQLKGFFSTNLRFRPQAEGAGGKTRMVASWKCNLPLLEEALLHQQLFLPPAYFGAAAYGQHAMNTAVRVPVLSLLGGDSPIGGSQRYRERWEPYVRCYGNTQATPQEGYGEQEEESQQQQKSISVGNPNSDYKLLREVIIPNANHTIYYDQPQATLAAILKFLADLEIISK